MKNATIISKSNNTMVDENIQRSCNTPVPYLFGGLTLMLCLIAVALLILACSFRKSSSSNGNNNSNNSNSANGSQKLTLKNSTSESGNEPKIVVIMAGDDNPTYLAKPLPSPMVIPFTSNHGFVETV